MKKTALKQNPFAFGGTVHGKQFVNRDEERQELVRDIQNHTNLILYAPRRYGKTSLILQIFEDMKKRNSKFVGLYIDFFKIHSREKFLQLISKEYSQKIGWSADKIISFFKSAVQSLQPSLTINNEGKPELDISFTRPMQSGSFEEVLALPRKLAEKGYLVCVVFDEFQEITRLNGQNFQQELRSIIQHHSNVSYTFCGSKQHLISKIFSFADSPLYNIGKMKYVNKIKEKSFANFINKNMKTIQSDFNLASAKAIYQKANGVPYYVQMLAYEYYNLALMNQNHSAETLLAAAVNNLVSEKSEEYIAIFERFSPTQKKIIEIVLKYGGTNLFRRDILSEYHIPASTLKKGLSKLVESGILSLENNIYQFSDIFFEQWLED